jgi:hypothetical protein
MFGAGKNMHRVYGVGLYLLAVMFLYGKKEVLPKSVIKEYSNPKIPGSLKYEKKMDPKQAIDYRAQLVGKYNIIEAGASGGHSMYAVGKELKKTQKVK